MAPQGKPHELPKVGAQVPMRVGPAWLELTHRIMETGWEALSDQRSAEMFAYVKSTPMERIATDMRDITLMEGLSGDQGMMENFVNALLNKISQAEPLNASETYGLCMVLARIVRSPQGVQLAAGAEKRRGGTRQGAKSIMVALDVIHQLTHGTSNNFEDAWAATAAQKHLSESAVKKCWMERRKLLLETLRHPLDITAAQMVAQSVAAGFRKA